MSFKPEDVRIPWNEYATEEEENSPPLPSMYSQDYVDNLKREVDHYKTLYRKLLLKTRG